MTTNDPSSTDPQITTTDEVEPLDRDHDDNALDPDPGRIADVAVARLRARRFTAHDERRAMQKALADGDTYSQAFKEQKYAAFLEEQRTDAEALARRCWKETVAAEEALAGEVARLIVPCSSQVIWLRHQSHLLSKRHHETNHRHRKRSLPRGHARHWIRACSLLLPGRSTRLRGLVCRLLRVLLACGLHHERPGLCRIHHSDQAQSKGVSGTTQVAQHTAGSCLCLCNHHGSSPTSEHRLLVTRFE